MRPQLARLLILTSLMMGSSLLNGCGVIIAIGAIAAAAGGGGGGGDTDASSGSQNSSNKPGPFSLVSPSNGETVSSLRPSFIWNDSAGETAYQFQIGPDGVSWAIYDVDFPANTASYDLPWPGSPLGQGRKYWWRVNAVNGYGNTLCSEDYYFITPTPWTVKIDQGVFGSPTVRAGPAVVWDGSRLILFGGNDGVHENDLWWYNPTTNVWTQKIPSGDVSSPGQRSYARIVWDGNRVIMFGGDSGTGFYNDLWFYDPGMNSWTEKISQGAAGSPSGRLDHALAWNGSNVVLFGGRDSSSYRNDLWWYSPSTNTWTEKIPQDASGSPSSRVSPGGAWDGSELIIFGGQDSSGQYKHDTWGYNPANNSWTEKLPASTPTETAGHLMEWDGRRVTKFGGQNQYGFRDEVHWYDPVNNNWTGKVYDALIGSPSRRMPSGLVWTGTTVLMYGGVDATGNRNDLWSYDPSAWGRRIPNEASSSPSARNGQRMVWSGTNMILFGGRFSNVKIKSDLWLFNPQTNAWTQKIADGAEGSPARTDHATVWDGIKVIMFGGFSTLTNTSKQNDLWWYDPNTNSWTQKIVQLSLGSPSPRFGATMIWNGTRAIMFGGWDDAGARNDLWWYDPGTNTWTEKISQGTPGSPAGRVYHSFVWDGTRAILFGGNLSVGTTNDLWWYDPQTNSWTEKISDGAPSSPVYRYSFGMTWDGLNVILFGGGENRLNDLWLYNPTENVWTQKYANGDVKSPTGRLGMSMEWDGKRAIMFGGGTLQGDVNDLWEFAP